MNHNGLHSTFALGLMLAVMMLPTIVGFVLFAARFGLE